MTKFTREKIDKLGNTIIYFSEKISDLTRIKLLKLLFLLEEAAIRRYGTHFLGIDFEIWKAGPVARDVFIELSWEPVILKDYIEGSYTGKSSLVKTKKSFEDQGFETHELEMLDFIIDRFGDLSDRQLINFTLQPGSLWHLKAKETGLLDAFEAGLMNSSTEKVDFSSILTGTANEA